MSQKAELCIADAFAIRIRPPLNGHLTVLIRLGAEPNIPLTLAAKHDELTKLRSWMEDIARGISLPTSALRTARR